MLRDVPTQPPKFGVLLDESLHVGDGLYPRRGGRGDGAILRLVIGNVSGNGGAKVTKVGEEILREEGVGGGREDEILRH